MCISALVIFCETGVGMWFFSRRRRHRSVSTVSWAGRCVEETDTKETGAKLGKKILADFDTYITSFKKIIPNDYQRMMTEIAKGEARGLNHDESVMEAFKVVTAGN